MHVSNIWHRKSNLRRGNKTIAGWWGLLEATCFFIVPDVFLSYLALTHLRKALISCLYAAAGAVVGGAIMYGFGHYTYSDALAFLNMIPTIHMQQINDAQALLTNSLFFGLLEGSLTGIPYKIFAVLIGHSNTHLLLFLLASIPARLFRFLLVIAITAFVAQVLLKRLSTRRKKQLHLGLWLLFYIGYFMHMGW